MSEPELLRAFRENRSEQAFAELVRRYAALVYSVANRRLSNAALAEDITQIVFIRFAKAPPAVRTSAELAAWLHRTTVHVTIDTWRSETRRRNREQKAVLMELNPAQDALWEELSPRLDEALNQLNDEDRHALLLRFFGQKAMREVGAALGVSEDAAKMRVSRALERLRKQFGAGGAACTVVVLGALLEERSVQAAPVQLLARLAALHLPAAAVTGIGGKLAVLSRISGFKLSAGAAALLTACLIAIHHSPQSQPRGPEVTTATQPVNPSANLPKIAIPNRPGASGLTASVTTLAHGVKMRFHVVDAETGVGLPGTKIHVAMFGPGGKGETHDLWTDNAGAVAIPPPDDPTKNQGMNVFVVAEGHVPMAVGFRGEGDPYVPPRTAALASGKIEGNPTDYTVKLEPALTVGGIVVDEPGLPVPGVEIKIQNPGNKPGQSENVDFQTCPVTNHDDGSWTCSYIPKDYTNEIRFILKKPGYAVTFPSVHVPLVDLNNLVLVIDRGYTITGLITDPQNRHLANAQINLITRERARQQSTKTSDIGVFILTGVAGETEFTHEPPLQTDANGRAMIRGLIAEGPTHAVLAVQAEGFAPQTNTLPLSAATNIANFTLSPGNIFRGRVVDAAGNPIANAIVQTDWDNQGMRQFEWSTHTDATGHFEWLAAPSQQTLYWIESDGYTVIRDLPLLADGSDHEITLEHSRVK